MVQSTGLKDAAAKCEEHLWIRYCMALHQCRAPADAVCYFYSPGGSTCLREFSLQQLFFVCTK